MKGWLWVQMRQLVRKGLWISGPAVTETPRTLHPGLWQVLSVSVQQVCRLFYYLSLILHPQVTLHHVMLPGIHFGPWAADVPLSSWSLRWKPCPEAALSTSIPVPNWPKSKENLSDNSCMDFQGKAVYSKVVTQKEKNQSESHREEAECSPLGGVLHLAVCLFETWPRVSSEPGVLGPPGGARAWGRMGWSTFSLLELWRHRQRCWSLPFLLLTLTMASGSTLSSSRSEVREQYTAPVSPFLRAFKFMVTFLAFTWDHREVNLLSWSFMNVFSRVPHGCTLRQRAVQLCVTEDIDAQGCVVPTTSTNECLAAASACNPSAGSWARVFF